MQPQLTSVHIAISRADGGVSIMAFLVVGRGSILPAGATWLDQSKGWWTRVPNAETVELEIAAVPDLQATAWRQIDPASVPQDRTYRDAWTDNGESIVHDMGKAREVHRHQLRAVRSVAMRDLDAQWMRANGQGKKQDASAIEAKRQAWRDAPADPRIDAAQTVEELKRL